MWRYTLIFLLVNTYGSRILAVPVRNENSNGKILIGDLLRNLSKQCKNEFVLGQIQNKNTVCDVELDFHDINLQCLMFFDANRLLCNSTVFSTTDLSTEFTSSITEKQNVSVFCSEAVHFTVPPAAYQQTITTVFRNDVACKKVCADDDIRTGDTNFFCKYYKWTLQKLDGAQSSTHLLISTVNPAGSANDVIATQGINVSDRQLKVTSDTLASDTKPQSGKAEETDQQPSEVARHESSSVAQSTGIQNQGSSKLPDKPASTIKKNGQEAQHTPGADEKPGHIETPPNPDGDVDGGNNEASIDVNAGGIKVPDVAIQQIETPGQHIPLESEDPDDASMDMEGDDGREGNMDTGDDGEDQIDSDHIKLEEAAKKSNNKIETPVSLNGEGSHREFFQNPDGFTEDDDHFFPFFLTVVIVVVVLYVLYHNKNKVGKMFFGLIVEGRQTGRRRNSRGHAYRRLDTLEQAMSTNAAAPPSKIIY